MPDTYVNTATTNFNSSLVAAISKRLQDILRGGLSYTLPGSIIGATLMSGNSGVFRSFSVGDLDEDGDVALEDGDADPVIEDLSVDFVTFTGTAFGRSVGLTDNAKARSPFNLFATATERVARDAAVTLDNVARNLYKEGGDGDTFLYGGSGNTQTSEVAAGDKITASLVKDAVAILRGKNVKPLMNGLYAMPCHPFVIRDLMADTDFINEIRYADPASLLNGEVARYAGVSIIDAGSRGLKYAAGGTGAIDVYQATVIGADALFAALGGVQIIPVTGADHADPLNRRDVISYKGFKGGVINDGGTVSTPVDRFVGIEVATTLGV